MNKYIFILIASTLLNGCLIKNEEVGPKMQSCRNLGGEPTLIYLTDYARKNGKAYDVGCKFDENLSSVNQPQEKSNGS